MRVSVGEGAGATPRRKCYTYDGGRTKRDNSAGREPLSGVTEGS
jgi:hypothetical protein